MRVMLVGGSNTGMEDGWAYYLPGLLPEHDVDNQWLGVIGSLFGLLRLLKLKKENHPRPDVVVLEYALNDTLMMRGAFEPSFLETVLHEIIDICARDGVKLLFLCLVVRPVKGQPRTETSIIVEETYKSVARERGVDCLLQSDILGAVNFGDYANRVHLAPEPARKVAQAVAERLRQPIAPLRESGKAPAFAYLDPSAAELTGAATLTRLASSVFSGDFVRLEWGGGAFWPCAGKLVAIMIRSSEDSGYYRVSAGGKSYRKNAQVTARAILPKLMIMQYAPSQPETRDGVLIDMPESQELLMGLDVDPTKMECAPQTAFADQTLEVNGILVWRDAPEAAGGP